MIRSEQDSRRRQIVVGVSILMALTLLVCGTLIGSRYLPGLLGEWIGTMIGVVTTPFFMEGSFIVLGLTTVMAINHWRQKRDGEDFVYLEQIEGPDMPPNIPEHATWALYSEKPLDGEVPSPGEQVEGALAIGDFESAAEIIAAMSDEELKRPETLVLRIELAKATGKTDLAARLENELRATEQLVDRSHSARSPV